MPLERLLKTIHSRVFISHNKKDKDIASQIAVFLVTEKIGTWFDEWEISALQMPSCFLHCMACLLSFLLLPLHAKYLTLCFHSLFLLHP